MLDGVSDEQLRSLLSAWRIGVTQLDGDYRILGVNNELLRIDGRSRENLVGKTIWEAWPGSETRLAGDLIRNAIEKQEGGAGKQYRIERSDKDMLWIDFRVHPWSDGAAIFMLDMTDRLALEREYTDLERRYVLASKATEDIMYEWDLGKDELRFSDIGATILGAGPLTSPAMSWWRERLHPDDQDAVFEQIENSLRSGGTQWDLEFRLWIAAGRYVLVHKRGFVLYDSGGKPMRVIGAMSDITDIRENEEKVKTLQNQLIHVSRLSAMDTMASVMAHELNQPLAAVGTYLAGTEKLLNASEGPNISLVNDGIRKAREATSRAAKIILQTRKMTRKVEPARMRMSVRAAVVESAALVLDSRKKERDLRIEVPEDLAIEADLIQIEQVLMNVIRNALEANDETGGRGVVVRTRQHDDQHVEIIVEDRGPGISEEAIPKLFDFFSTTKKDGMGIGLPISRTIVEAHNGSIHAENRKSGGARFRMILPN